MVNIFLDLVSHIVAHLYFLQARSYSALLPAGTPTEPNLLHDNNYYNVCNAHREIVVNLLMLYACVHVLMHTYIHTYMHTCIHAGLQLWPGRPGISLEQVLHIPDTGLPNYIQGRDECYSWLCRIDSRNACLSRMTFEIQVADQQSLKE